MPKILSKLFLTLFISLGLFRPVQSCAWDPAWDLDFYRFFEPEVVGPEGFDAFHYTFSLLYDYGWQDPKNFRADNLADWRQHMDNRFSLKDIEEIVYDTDYPTLSSARSGFGLENNSLAGAFRDGKFAQEFEYLLLAKECEPYNRTASWNEERQPLGSPNHQLIDGFRNLYAKANSDWLKIRSAFQMVRLLHYAGFYKEAIQTYEEYAAPIQGTGSPIEGWALSQYAGALHGSGDVQASNYLFSKVFAEVPSRRVQAWLSFDIQDEEDWQAVLNRCANDAERANVYSMRAISPNAVATQDMAEIHRLDPGSEQLDLLLVREINKLEEAVLGSPWSGSGMDEEGDAGALDRQMTDLHGLIGRVQASGKMADPTLWVLADAYLDHLRGNSAQARAKLARIEGSAKVSTEAKLLDLSIKIAQVKQVDRSVENDITKDLFNLKDDLPQEQVEELERYRDESFGNAYERQREWGKALLARRRIYQAQDDLDIQVLDALMAFDKKSGKTLYEKELHGRLSNSFSYWDLMEMKGTALFRKLLFPEAIAVFEKIPENVRNESEFFQIGPDPFAYHIRDIINCEPGCHTNEFTKLSLAKTLLGLQKTAASNPAKAGECYHLLGNAIFNLSYYGAAWKGMDYYRGYSWGSEDEDNVVDLSRAQQYYEKAIAKSDNREIAALSALMHAKCQMVRNFGPIPEQVSGYDQLLRNYRDTEVYRMALQECKYFVIYMNM